MSAAYEPLPLRPLGLGEIFDRAVTLYVRNFVLFALIALVPVVPLLVVQYTAASNATTFAQILQQAQTVKSATPPNSQTPTRQAPTFPSVDAKESAIILVFFLLVLLSTPLTNVACAFAVGDLYESRAPDWRSAYGRALRHWGGVLGTFFVGIIILAGLLLFCILIIGVFTAIMAVFGALLPIASVIGVAMVIVLMLTLMLVLLVGSLAIAIAYYSVAIESKDVFGALGSGFRRVFSRRDFGRSLLMVLALSAVNIAQFIVGLFSGFFGTFFKSLLFESVLSGLLSIVGTAFLAVLVAVYYYDLRIRDEGIDVASMVDRLEAQAAG